MCCAGPPARGLWVQPLSREKGTTKPVRARFWPPWLESFSVRQSSKCLKLPLARQRVEVLGFMAVCLGALRCDALAQPARRSGVWGCCRAKSAHIRQSRPDSGVGFQGKNFQVFPSSLGSGVGLCFRARRFGANCAGPACLRIEGSGSRFEGATLPATFFCKSHPPPKKLSTYECRETLGLFHIPEWTVSVEIDLGKKVAGYVSKRTAMWHPFFNGKCLREH